MMYLGQNDAKKIFLYWWNLKNKIKFKENNDKMKTEKKTFDCILILLNSRLYSSNYRRKKSQL